MFDFQSIDQTIQIYWTSMCALTKRSCLSNKRSIYCVGGRKQSLIRPMNCNDCLNRTTFIEQIHQIDSQLHLLIEASLWFINWMFLQNNTIISTRKHQQSNRCCNIIFIYIERDLCQKMFHILYNICFGDKESRAIRKPQFNLQ